MMKRLLAITLFAAWLALAGNAYALDLSQARAQGIVGEKPDGYVAAVTPSAEADAVISEVNTRRRAEYEKISKDNGQPVSVVAKIAAGRIIGGLPAGSYYKAADGSWKKK